MTTPFTPDWAGIVGVSVSLLGTLAITHQLRSRGLLGPEGSRKVMHVVLGLSTLSFPLLFHTAWPAMVLACLTAIVLILLRAGTLGSMASTVVHGVPRRSEGDLYFPFAAALLFAITGGDTVAYVLPLATLTIADPVAAFVGRRLGRTRYASGNGIAEKSIEGSAAFFAVALSAALLVLMTCAQITPLTVGLIAVPFAFVATLLEAVAWRGLDNLFIPVGGSLLLTWLLGLDMRALVTVLIVIVALSAAAVSQLRHRAASPGALARVHARRVLT